jgi:hypothetical protein
MRSAAGDSNPDKPETESIDFRKGRISFIVNSSYAKRSEGWNISSFGTAGLIFIRRQKRLGMGLGSW